MRTVRRAQICLWQTFETGRCRPCGHGSGRQTLSLKKGGGVEKAGRVGVPGVGGRESGGTWSGASPQCSSAGAEGGGERGADGDGSKAGEEARDEAEAGRRLELGAVGGRLARVGIEGRRVGRAARVARRRRAQVGSLADLKHAVQLLRLAAEVELARVPAARSHMRYLLLVAAICRRELECRLLEPRGWLQLRGVVVELRVLVVVIRRRLGLLDRLLDWLSRLVNGAADGLNEGGEVKADAG
mmetsp:Transcript_4109/g.8859  ORF Transcript_4109/g.8859 Transcript_4109/m.8859 type:complete len:243 (-) Transcript_4109:1276-2004(-)